MQVRTRLKSKSWHSGKTEIFINQHFNTMNVVIRDSKQALAFYVKNISVHTNLTFCEINDEPKLYPILVDFVKSGTLHSFEVRGEVIKLSIYTNNVELS